MRNAEQLSCCCSLKYFAKCALRAGFLCGREELYYESNLSQAENPAEQGSFFANYRKEKYIKNTCFIPKFVL